jgi:Tol biopolymer transport system component
VIIIAMIASCIVLVGISYIMLDVLSGIVVVPKTKVEEISTGGELAIPLEDTEVRSMQVSGDGRFLALIEGSRGGASAVLRVFEMEGERREIHTQEVDGSKLAWLGYAQYLVFEDQGDIFLLDLEQGGSENLTSSSAYDSNPLPSPDGRHILWTISTEGSTSSNADFWVMAADGSGKEFLAEAQALAAWDPAGGMIMSLHDKDDTDTGTEYLYLLQTAALGREGWDDYMECDNDVEYVWWPSQDTVLCVGPEVVKGEDAIKGVWFWVKQPDQIKKVGSTDGLGLEETYYIFFPSRNEQQLAYVGRKGLEYFDYEDRVIYRYPDLGARPPLAWNEIGGELFFLGPDGVYRVALKER